MCGALEDNHTRKTEIKVQLWEAEQHQKMMWCRNVEVGERRDGTTPFGVSEKRRGAHDGTKGMGQCREK